MKLLVRLVISLFFLTIVSACSLPLKVTKVESMAAPVEGVRYFLKRPSYVAGLKVEFDKAKFLDDVNTKNCTESSSSCSEDLKREKESTREEIIRFPIKSNKKVEWIKADQIKNIRDIYCIQIPEESKTPQPIPINITLRQTMKGDPILFEAKSRITPPHWFADSESSITLDDDGYLTAIMAGEDDKSLEFIQAVAGLAVSSFGLGFLSKGLDDPPLIISELGNATSTKDQCLLIKNDEFHTYVTKHIELSARRNNLQRKLNETYQKLELSDEHASKPRATSITAKDNYPNNVSVNSDTPERMKLRFELVSLLKEEIESINKELEKLQYNLPSKDFVINELGKDEKGNETVVWKQKSKNSKPWLIFKLTKQ